MIEMYGLKIADLGIIKENALIISDLHLGYEEAMEQKGILLPRTLFDLQKKRLEMIFSQAGAITTLVINGDFKHEFGGVLSMEWRDTRRFLEFVFSQVKKIVVVKGNHDIMLLPLARKYGISVVSSFLIGDVLVMHGDAVPLPSLLKKAKTIIIGHEHPAITLRDGAKEEKFKCYLAGRYKRKQLIVQPSFFLLDEGSDVNRRMPLSSLIKDYKSFRCYIVGDEVYPFGNVKDIPSH
ncbi:TPA: metallophosphoesterase [Candidatus Woesearchaeota archaeon]|nr:metallophosphoesterase [Candidatus Woesearchaeota archaeon]HIH49236.1 metallophosphoesterase [Candidatus Woesearchaeota archaeon]